jgi:hypothetical protein
MIYKWLRKISLSRDEGIARDKVERAKKIFREVKKKCRELKEMES